jgi:hypothetical protein
MGGGLTFQFSWEMWAKAPLAEYITHHAKFFHKLNRATSVGVTIPYLASTLAKNTAAFDACVADLMRSITSNINKAAFSHSPYDFRSHGGCRNNASIFAMHSAASDAQFTNRSDAIHGTIMDPGRQFVGPSI